MFELKARVSIVIRDSSRVRVRVSVRVQDLWGRTLGTHTYTASHVQI